MSERERPTAPQVELLDIDGPDQPFPGQRILALTEGNKLVELLWAESWRPHIFGWCRYPKRSEAIKLKMKAHYFRNASEEFNS